MTLNKKEMTVSAAIGLAIGTACGIMVAIGMLGKAKQCDAVERENRLLREMVTFYQEQPPCGE